MLSSELACLRSEITSLKQEGARREDAALDDVMRLPDESYYTPAQGERRAGAGAARAAGHPARPSAAGY